jgi:hypothetical protein
MTFALILLVVMANGLVQTVTLVSGLTLEECEQHLMAAPLPYEVNGHVVSFTCEIELQ